MLSDCHPPGNTRSARPTHCECYFQIPANAEVKSVPVSSLPPAIQQKIRRLGSCNDSDTAPSVICVSQVTKHYFPVSCQPGTFNGAMADMLSPAEHPLYGQSRSPPIRPNLRPMEENIDPAACFVPVKSSKKTASTILELLQAGDLQYMENVLPQRGDFFCFNSSILSIKANVLCMHKNRMYLLPELPAKVSHADANVQELSTRYPGDTTSSSGSIIDISSNTEDEFIFQDPWSEIDDLSPDSDTSVRQDDLGKMTADPCRSVVDKSSVTVIQKDENGGYLAEEIPSTNENTALRPTRFTHSEITDQELITGYPKDTISSPGTGTASNTEDDFSLDYSWSETDDVSPSSDPSVQQDDLGNMTTKSSGNGNRWPGRDKSSVAVIQKDETRCHLEEAIYSKTENPSLGPTHFTHPEREEQELITGYPKDTISSPGTGTASKTEGEFSLDYSWSETDDVSPSSDPSVQQDDLGNMTTESSGNGNRWPGRDKSSVAVIQKDETRCYLEEAIYSKKENPSLGPTHFTHSEREEQELITGYPKDTISSPGTGTASNTEDDFSLDYSWLETDDVSPSSDPSVQQDDLGNMTTESSGNGNRWPGRDKSSVAVIQKDETRCHLAEAIYSKKENPSLGPTHFTHSEREEQELITGYPKDTISSPGTGTASNTEDDFSLDYSWLETDDVSPSSDPSVQQDDLGNMTTESSGNGNRWPGRDKSSVAVIQKDETRCHLEEAIYSKKENPSLGPTHFTHSEREEQELITGYPKDTISCPGTGTASNTEDDFSLDYSWLETDDVSPSSDPSVQQDDLGNMTTESSGNGNRWPGRDKSSVAVIQKDETRCHLEEAIYSKKENPSLGPTHFTHPEREEQELITGYPKDTISSPGTGTASNTEDDFSLDYSWSETDDVSPSSDPSVQQDDLGNMTTESSGNGNRWPGRDKSSVAVIQKDETRCHLEEAIYSKKENPSLGPTHFTHPEREEQIPVRRKQIKRKISSLDNVENVKKTNDLEDSVTNQETKTVHTLSSFSDTLPTSSSASLPVGSPNSPSGQPTSFLPCQQSTGADLFSIPTPQYGVSLIAPIPGGTNAAKATSFSSLAMSKSISRTADSAEPIQCHTIPANKSSLSDSISRPELTSLLDIDETTKAERARRLEERVREMNKIVEDMRMKNQKN
ncbi:dentin sialophosphoprotein-like [Pseudophryne corroboree]|uniref:dentin sialophosphoprotein-like n=1 Tax=Pseudophryne corroboree TaxID=495146 RepID=UPI003081BCC5